MIQAAAVALRTYLLPMTSTRAFRIGALGFLLTAGLVVLAVLVKPLADFLARSSLDHLRKGVVLPGVPLAALLLSEIPLRDGIRHRTLLYPLLGPVSRPVLASVRTSATAVLCALSLTALVLIVRMVQGGATEPLGGELVAIWLGSAAYVGLFGLIHLLSRRGLLVGLAFYGLLDDPLGRLPFALRNLSPSFHLRVLAHQETQIELPISFSPPESSAVLSVAILAGLAVLLLGVTAALFTRKPLGELC